MVCGIRSDSVFLWCECVKEDNRGNKNLDVAINYALNHRTELSNFFTLGEVEPTSNIVESALRPIANLRKILMQTGNDVSSQLMMMLATLLQTAPINNLAPQMYLDTYLTWMLEMGQDAPKEELVKLLPWSSEMQEAVKHQDLPRKKPERWTDERIAKAKEWLKTTMCGILVQNAPEADVSG